MKWSPAWWADPDRLFCPSACSAATRTVSGWCSSNLVVFVLLALLCHGELLSAPAWPAGPCSPSSICGCPLGGVVGGVFPQRLVAPQLFTPGLRVPDSDRRSGFWSCPGCFAGGRKYIVTEIGPVLGLALLAISAAVSCSTCAFSRSPARPTHFQIIPRSWLAVVMLLQASAGPPRFPGAVGARLCVDGGFGRPGFNRGGRAGPAASLAFTGSSRPPTVALSGCSFSRPPPLPRCGNSLPIRVRPPALASGTPHLTITSLPRRRAIS